MLVLPTLLYRCNIITEQDKCRITSAEMELTRRMAKYTWQDYKISDIILSELKINPVAKKIQNCRNKWIQQFQHTDRDRLPHLIMKYQPCEKQSQGQPLKRL